MGHINGSLEPDRKQLWKVHTSARLCRLSYEKKKDKKKNNPKTAEPRMKLARLRPTPTTMAVIVPVQKHQPPVSA